MDAMAESPISAYFEHLFADAPPAPAFMGITLDRARDLAATRGIPLRVIVLDPEKPSEVALTMDLRRDRLNVLISRGIVVRAGYF